MEGCVSLVVGRTDTALALVKEKSFDTLLVTIGTGQVEWSVAVDISNVDAIFVTHPQQQQLQSARIHM